MSGLGTLRGEHPWGRGPLHGDGHPHKTPPAGDGDPPRATGSTSGSRFSPIKMPRWRSPPSYPLRTLREGTPRPAQPGETPKSPREGRGTPRPPRPVRGGTGLPARRDRGSSRRGGGPRNGAGTGAGGSRCPSAPSRRAKGSGRGTRAWRGRGPVPVRWGGWWVRAQPGAAQARWPRGGAGASGAGARAGPAPGRVLGAEAGPGAAPHSPLPPPPHSEAPSPPPQRQRARHARCVTPPPRLRPPPRPAPSATRTGAANGRAAVVGGPLPAEGGPPLAAPPRLAIGRRRCQWERGGGPRGVAWGRGGGKSRREATPLCAGHAPTLLPRPSRGHAPD